MKFQDKIGKIRKEKGFSQEDLAEQLGVSRQAVAKWESGLSYPDVDNLIALSVLFQISIDGLLKSDEDNCSVLRTKGNKALTEQTIAFLRKAKNETYAGQGNAVDSSRPGSHDYRYAEGDYTYIDSYFGGEKFLGEEVLYQKGIPIWSMNYSGRVLEDSFSGSFLKEALLLVPEEYPFRGPAIYRSGDFSYHCIINGDTEWYQGYEEIFLLDHKIYECYFHGGLIK